MYHFIIVIVSVPDTTSYIRGWIQMVLAPNDLFSWNNKYNKYAKYNKQTHFHLFLLSCAHYSLCACWHPEAVEKSSSLASCRLLILSRPVTSFLFPYLGSTDAPYSRHGVPGPLFPRWRPHSQGPRTHPSQDPEQYLDAIFLIKCTCLVLFFSSLSMQLDVMSTFTTLHGYFP